MLGYACIIVMSFLFLFFMPSLPSLAPGQSVLHSMPRASWVLSRFSLTCSDVERVAFHQAVGGGDHPHLAEEGAPAEQLTAVTHDQPHLGTRRGGRRRRRRRRGRRRRGRRIRGRGMNNMIKALCMNMYFTFKMIF